MTAAPYNRSYWVIAEKLLAGCHPGAASPSASRQRLIALLDCGIRHFINLMEPGEAIHLGHTSGGYQVEMQSLAHDRGLSVVFENMPIKDMWIPTRVEMGRILDHIDSAMAQGRSLYVHCWGGRGRTGTVIGCYLARHGHALDHQVLKHIGNLRKNTVDAHLASPETSQQVDMVLSWVEGE